MDAFPPPDAWFRLFPCISVRGGNGMVGVGTLAARWFGGGWSGMLAVCVGMFAVGWHVGRVFGALAVCVGMIWNVVLFLTWCSCGLVWWSGVWAR